MASESREQEYSDSEIEQILGMTGSEGKFTLRGIEEAIREDPLLASGLVLALGILIGVALSCGRRSHS